MWYLWWTKWHWDRFFFEFLYCLLAKSFYHGSPRGDEQRLVCGCSSETPSHHSYMNNMNNTINYTHTHTHTHYTVISIDLNEGEVSAPGTFYLTFIIVGIEIKNLSL
jgi:hypothetical protein